MATAGLNSATATWGFSVLIGVGLAGALVALVTAAQLGSPGETMSVHHQGDSATALYLPPLRL